MSKLPFFRVALENAKSGDEKAMRLVQLLLQGIVADNKDGDLKTPSGVFLVMAQAVIDFHSEELKAQAERN